jgi:antitoxin PrlF
MARTTITSKGQVTIPKPIREFLHVKPGDQIDFVIDPKGQVLVRAGTLDIRDLKGILHRPGRRPVSLDEMAAVIGRRRRGRR